MMTVGELRRAIEDLDEDMEVQIRIKHSDGDEVIIGGLTSAEVEEDEDEGEDVLVLDGDEEELIGEPVSVENGPLDRVEMDDDDDEDDEPESTS